MAALNLLMLSLLLFAPTAFASDGPNVGGGGGKSRPDRCYVDDAAESNGQLGEQDEFTPSRGTVPLEKETGPRPGDTGCAEV